MCSPGPAHHDAPFSFISSSCITQHLSNFVLCTSERIGQVIAKALPCNPLGTSREVCSPGPVHQDDPFSFLRSSCLGETYSLASPRIEENYPHLKPPNSFPNLLYVCTSERISQVIARSVFECINEQYYMVQQGFQNQKHIKCQQSSVLSLQMSHECNTRISLAESNQTKIFTHNVSEEVEKSHVSTE